MVCLFFCLLGFSFLVLGQTLKLNKSDFEDSVLSEEELKIAEKVFKGKKSKFDIAEDEPELISSFASGGFSKFVLSHLKQLAALPVNVLYSRLSFSIAPQIFGHEDIKKALLLQLISSPTRKMEDGMVIRGDIHILLIGDPGFFFFNSLIYIFQEWQSLNYLLQFAILPCVQFMQMEKGVLDQE
jgi:hypothetical protein